MGPSWVFNYGLDQDENSGLSVFSTDIESFNNLPQASGTSTFFINTAGEETQYTLTHTDSITSCVTEVYINIPTETKRETVEYPVCQSVVECFNVNNPTLIEDSLFRSSDSIRLYLSLPDLSSIANCLGPLAPDSISIIGLFNNNNSTQTATNHINSADFGSPANLLLGTLIDPSFDPIVSGLTVYITINRHVSFSHLGVPGQLWRVPLCGAGLPISLNSVVPTFDITTLPTV